MCQFRRTLAYKPLRSRRHKSRRILCQGRTVRACVHSVGMLCGYMPKSSFLFVLICKSIDFCCCMLLVYYLSVIVCFPIMQDSQARNQLWGRVGTCPPKMQLRSGAPPPPQSLCPISSIGAPTIANLCTGPGVFWLTETEM